VGTPRSWLGLVYGAKVKAANKTLPLAVVGRWPPLGAAGGHCGLCALGVSRLPNTPFKRFSWLCIWTIVESPYCGQSKCTLGCWGGGLLPKHSQDNMRLALTYDAWCQADLSGSPIFFKYSSNLLFTRCLPSRDESGVRPCSGHVTSHPKWGHRAKDKILIGLRFSEGLISGSGNISFAQGG